MTTKTQTLLRRFLLGFISGALPAMALIAGLQPADPTWGALQEWLSKLALVGIMGGLSGAVTYLDKAYRWKDDPTLPEA